MREIKFRGKRVDGCHNWVFGSLVTNGDKYFIIANGNLRISYNNTLGNSSIQEVIPETVGQFTGLHDKNGKEIYKGDIVRYLDACGCSTECGTEYEEFLNTGVIEWDNDQLGYYVTNRESIDMEVFWENIEETEIIGTIHDNPELLTGDQEVGDEY